MIFSLLFPSVFNVLLSTGIILYVLKIKVKYDVSSFYFYPSLKNPLGGKVIERLRPLQNKTRQYFVCRHKQKQLPVGPEGPVIDLQDNSGRIRTGLEVSHNLILLHFTFFQKF